MHINRASELASERVYVFIYVVYVFIYVHTPNIDFKMLMARVVGVDTESERAREKVCTHIKIHYTIQSIHPHPPTHKPTPTHPAAQPNLIFGDEREREQASELARKRVFAHVHIHHTHLPTPTPTTQPKLILYKYICIYIHIYIYIYR